MDVCILLDSNGVLIATLSPQAVYFVKRQAEVVKADTFRQLIMYGDVAHLPLDHLSSLIESVRPLATKTTPYFIHLYILGRLYALFCSSVDLLTNDNQLDQPGPLATSGV